MSHRTGSRYTCMLALALVAGVACGDDDGPYESGETWVSDAGRSGGGAGRDHAAPARAGRSARDDAGRPTGDAAGDGSNQAGGGAGASRAPAPADGSAPVPPDAGSVDVADLTDAEIASITLTLHAGELERATLAERRAQRSAVVSFAQRLVLAHSATVERENALYRELAIEAADNAVSMQLRTSSTNLLDQLRASSARDFDAFYLAGLETVHENALSLIARMQNSASRPEIASELAQLRVDVIAHLTEARQLQSTLATPDDAGVEDAGE